MKDFAIAFLRDDNAIGWKVWPSLKVFAEDYHRSLTRVFNGRTSFSINLELKADVVAYLEGRKEPPEIGKPVFEQFPFFVRVTVVGQESK